MIGNPGIIKEARHISFVEHTSIGLITCISTFEDTLPDWGLMLPKGMFPVTMFGDEDSSPQARGVVVNPPGQSSMGGFVLAFSFL